MADKWMNGKSEQSDVTAVTGAVLGTVLAVAAVSGAPITAAALAIAAGVAIISGPGFKDIFNESASELGRAIADALGEAKSDNFSGDPFIALPWPGAISEDLSTASDPLVKTIRYVDPLVLDLDGNGLQITRLSQQIVFNAKGDGIKTATAGDSANHGLVVWNRDGNGSIDSGAEFSRDQAALADGRRAADQRVWCNLKRHSISQTGNFNHGETNLICTFCGLQLIGLPMICRACFVVRRRRAKPKVA